MKMNRAKNAFRNFIFGFFLKLYSILMPFVMRTVMIYFMGVQYLGLNSLFSSILQVLNLAELGVGSAMVYSMYKPIAEDDHPKICALMRLYRTYYRIIGLIILVVGLALTPFIPNLIHNGHIPGDLNIYVLYLLNLMATVLTYWLFAYKNSLLQAHQRQDLASKVMLFTHTVQYALQIFVIVCFKNYYNYLLITIGTQIATNLITAMVTNHMYPSYKPEGKLPKEVISSINRRIRDLFTSKIGSVVVDSADTIVISSFLGLTVLAVYQNYFFIISSLCSLVAIIFTASTAGIGNSIIVESKDKNFNDFRKLTFLIIWISGFVTVCLLNLYQIFIEIWVGKDLMLPFSMVICFCIYYYLKELNTLFNSYKDAAGIWHQDRFRPLLTAAANLVMNLGTVKFLGLYGVLLSTVISMLIVGMPWLMHNLFSTIFERKKMKGYLIEIFQYTLVVIGCCVLSWLMCQMIPLTGWAAFIVKGILCFTLFNVIFLFVYRNSRMLWQSLILINTVTGGKIPGLRRLAVKLKIKDEKAALQ